MSIDSLGGMNPEAKVIDVVHVSEPIALSQSLNITVALEYAPGKVILGLDEPGFLLADKVLGQTVTYQNFGQEAKTSGISLGQVDLT